MKAQSSANKVIIATGNNKDSIFNNKPTHTEHHHLAHARCCACRITAETEPTHWPEIFERRRERCSLASPCYDATQLKHVSGSFGQASTNHSSRKGGQFVAPCTMVEWLVGSMGNFMTSRF